LVNGKPITLANGRTIQPDDVLGPDRPGVSIAVVGDVGQVTDLVDAVNGVDVLVCEATYLERDRDLARRFGHLMAGQAAWLAREAGARKLVLNHLSQRYRVRDILAESRPIFEETVVARDFDHYSVTREKVMLSNQELTDDAILPEDIAVADNTLD
jgi:ribonuclease Z